MTAASMPAGVERTVSPRTRLLRRRIRFIVAFTIAYNVVEAIVALAAGGAASSAALIGFGLDSIVEVLSAAAVAWQFAAPDPERRERTALRIIALSFFGLAAYVSVDAVLSLAGLREPEHSPVGIALAAISLIVMPTVSWIERRTGPGARVRVRHRRLEADAHLRVPVRRAAGRPAPELAARLGVGGFRRGARDRRIRDPRGRRGMARRRVRRAGRRPHRRARGRARPPRRRRAPPRARRPLSTGSTARAHSRRT